MVMKRTAILVLLIVLSGCYVTGGKDGKKSSKNSTGQAACTCENIQLNDPDSKTGDLKPQSGGSVSIRTTSEPGSLLSMFVSHPSIDQVVDKNVLEPLVFFESNGQEKIIQPSLASSWSVDESNTIYTFSLKQDLLWHDGKKFSAKDVVFTFDILTDPASGAVYRKRFTHVAEVTAIDKWRVKIKLDHPDPFFLRWIAQVMILPSHIMSRLLLKKSEQHAWLPVGTGPFKISKRLIGEQITLVKNSNWHGGKVYLDEIVYKIVPDLRVALDLFEGKKLDIVMGVSSGTNVKDGFFFTKPQNQFNAFMYNTINPIFSEVKIRQAISLLIDQDAIRCSIMRCQAGDLNDLWPELEGNSSIKKNYNPSMARKLLDDAGWKISDSNGLRYKGKVKLSFTFLMADFEQSQKRMATVIQHDLKRAGIEMKVKVVNWGTYTDRLRTRSFDASIVNVPTAPFFDVEALFHTRGIETGINFGYFTNNSIDLIIDKMKITSNLVEQKRLRNKLLNLIVKLNPITFLSRPYDQFLIRNNIHGQSLNAGSINMAKIWRNKRRSNK